MYKCIVQHHNFLKQYSAYLQAQCRFLYIGPDRLESIILKIIGKKIDNLPCHRQSIIPENNRFFAYYSGK